MWFLLHECSDFTVPAKSQVPSELGAQLGDVKDLAARTAGLTLGKIVMGELWRHVTYYIDTIFIQKASLSAPAEALSSPW